MMHLYKRLFTIKNYTTYISVYKWREIECSTICKANHMVGRAALVVSPFYFILPVDNISSFLSLPD